MLLKTAVHTRINLTVLGFVKTQRPQTEILYYVQNTTILYAQCIKICIQIWHSTICYRFRQRLGLFIAKDKYIAFLRQTSALCLVQKSLQIVHMTILHMTNQKLKNIF